MSRQQDSHPPLIRIQHIVIPHLTCEKCIHFACVGKQ